MIKTELIFDPESDRFPARPPMTIFNIDKLGGLVFATAHDLHDSFDMALNLKRQGFNPIIGAYLEHPFGILLRGVRVIDDPIN